MHSFQLQSSIKLPLWLAGLPHHQPPRLQGRLTALWGQDDSCPFPCFQRFLAVWRAFLDLMVFRYFLRIFAISPVVWPRIFSMISFTEFTVFTLSFVYPLAIYSSLLSPIVSAT